MSSFKSCFRNSSDIQLLIQIADTFDKFLNDAYTWVSEIKESLSPAKACTDKHDVVCIPKTPSQIRAKRTRAAKRRKSSLIPSTAIKTSVHKKTTNRITRRTRNSQDQDETYCTKVEKESISAGKSQPKRKLRKTTSKESSEFSTATSTEYNNDGQDSVELISKVKVVTSRPRKNLLAEFNNASENLEIKTRKSRKCNSNIDQEKQFNAGDDDQLTDCSQNVSNRDKTATNLIKMIVDNDDVEKSFKRESTEQIIPFAYSNDLSPLENCAPDVLDNDSKVSPHRISYVKEVDLEIKKSASLGDLKEKVDSSSLVAAAQAMEVDVLPTKIEDDNNSVEMMEHLETNEEEETEMKGDKETEVIVTRGLDIETRSSNDKVPIITQNKVNRPTSSCIKPSTPKNNVAAKVNMFEMQIRSKPKPQIRKKESLQSKDKKQKISQYNNSNTLFGNQPSYSNLSNLNFKDQFTFPSSDLVMLKLQHQQLAEKLQKAFNIESNTDPNPFNKINDAVKLPPKDDLINNIKVSSKSSEVAQTNSSEVIEVIRCSETKIVDETSSKPQVSMDLSLKDSIEIDHVANSFDSSFRHCRVERVVEEIKSLNDGNSSVEELKPTISEDATMSLNAIVAENTAMVLKPIIANKTSDESVSIENITEELKYVINDNDLDELKPIRISHEQEMESFDEDKTLDGMCDENEENMASFSEQFVRFVKDLDYIDDKIDPVCRDSGFASIHSRDTRHSAKSNCYGDKFDVVPENDGPLLDDFVPSSADDNAYLDLLHSPGLSTPKSYRSLADINNVVSPSTLDELVPPVLNESISLHFEDLSKLIGLETYQPSQSFLKLNQSHLTFSTLKTDSPEKSISNHISTQPTSSPKFETPTDEQIQIEDCHDEKETSNIVNVLPSISTDFHSKNKKIDLFNVKSIADDHESSVRPHIMKVPTKEKGRLFAPITSSPSHLFSSISSSTSTAIQSQNLPTLTTFSANYSPKVLQSPFKEAENSKKFSNFLFSSDVPTKSSKSPVKHNPVNFSERVFCKSNLKPVFSSNLRTPLKGSLFETANKANLNVAVVKSLPTPSTSLTAKKFDFPEFKEIEMEKNKRISPSTKSPLLSKDEADEKGSNLTKESPVKSLFSNIKDSCKKIFKRSPSPQSKAEDKNLKSFWPSPKTPPKSDHHGVQGNYESGMGSVGTPVAKDKMLLPDIIVCDSPFNKKTPTSSYLAQSSTAINSTTALNAPSSDVLKILEKKSIKAMQESKEDVLASSKKSKKKSATLKVGLPWKKNKKRKSSGHGIKRVSSEFGKLTGFKKHQSGLLDLDEDLDDIVQTYKTDGGDSVDNIDNTYNSNLSLVAPKNLNSTYMVISDKTKSAENVLKMEPRPTKIKMKNEPSHLIRSAVDLPPNKQTATSTHLFEKQTCSVDHPSDTVQNATTVKQEPRRSGVKRHSSAAGLNEKQSSALKYMKISNEFVQPIDEALVKTSNEEDLNVICSIPIVEEGNMLPRDKTPQKEVPMSPDRLQNMRGDNFDVSSPPKTVSRTATIKDKVKQFFQSSTINRKTALTSTPSSVSLPQRIATQLPDAKSHRRKSKCSMTNSLTKKSTFCSSLFKSRTTTKVHKKAGHESETSEGSTTCSTDSKNVTSKQMTSNAYPSNYFTVKSQTPIVDKAMSTEELNKKKFIDKKYRLDEADKRKAEQQHKKAEDLKRKREERLLLVEQKKKEQEEHARQQAAIANQKMNERLKASQKILEEKERGDKEKQKIREKRMLEAEQRRKQDEELKAQTLLLLEKEKQEEAARKQKELEAHEKMQKMAEIRKLEELRRMEAEKERKKEEHQRRMEEERKNRDIERKLQEHNKKLLSGQLKKGYSSSDLNKRTMRPYNPDNYDIHNIKYGDDTDDEDNPRKQIPKWATEPMFSQAIHMQHLNPPDLDAIFDLQFSINLCEAFSKRNPRYFKRTSSAHWDTAPITHNISMYRY